MQVFLHTEVHQIPETPTEAQCVFYFVKMRDVQLQLNEFTWRLIAHKITDVFKIRTKINPIETGPAPACHRTRSDENKPRPELPSVFKPYIYKSENAWSNGTGIHSEYGRSSTASLRRNKHWWRLCRRATLLPGKSGRRTYTGRTKLPTGVTWS